MLLVRTDPDAPKHRGITFLLADMHSPGVTVRPLKQINGDEDFHEVFFDDVRVPRSNVVGHINGGWEIAITTLMHERATLTFSRQLQSRAALTDMIAFARSWQRNGRTATRDPLIRQQLSQAVIDSAAIKYTAYRSLTRTLRGGVPGPEGSMEKLFWSEMYQRILETALTIQGPYAQLVKGCGHSPAGGQWPHLFLYSRGRTIAAGSSEIQRNIIAERVLGLPRGK
jgi:alkylation response protein AidB-like acyl-CoA dehydrogenase